MSTEDTTAPELQDTPETDAPAAEEAGTRAEVDWEKRYNDLRPEFDRTNQRLSQMEQFYESLSDPETQAEALKRLGLELDAAEDEGDYDEIEVIKRELSELKQARQQDTQTAQERQAFEAFLDDTFGQIEALEAEVGRELDEEEADFIMDAAEAAAVRGQAPDVKQLFARFESLDKKRHARWIASKKAPRVMSGQSASKQPDLDNEKERHDWMLSRMMASDE